MRILFAVVFFFCVSANAVVTSVRIISSATNIPTSFGTGSDSLVLSAVRNAKTILIDNRGTGEIAVNCHAQSSSAPSNSSAQNIYVAGSSAVSIDNAFPNGACFIRSMTGSAITTGTVVIMVVGG